MCAEAVARARDDSRSMLLWGVIALKREDAEVAEGRLARARELARQAVRPAALVLGRGARRAPWPATCRVRWRSREEGADGLAIACRAAEQPRRCCSSRRATSPGAERLLRAALADEPSLPQLSKNLGDLLYRGGRFDEAQEATSAPRSSRPNWGTISTSSWATSPSSAGTATRARDCWRRAAELNPGHQLARSNLEILDVPA